MRRFLILLLSLFMYQQVWAACEVLTSAGSLAQQHADALGLMLADTSACPTDVFAFRALLNKAGLKLETTMVANRGFHNPSQGSFSLFEIVSGQGVERGDFFFGHFTFVNSTGQLAPYQNTDKNELMIEAFAWDSEKNVFNFYELRGDGKQGQWYYRGDSTDILADNSILHLQPDPQHPQFGDRLRCSACHGAGGAIMKELYSPNNDWWEPNRKLDLGGRHPDAALAAMLKTLVPAERLARMVVKANKKLLNKRETPLSLQEQLRPLFCPVELNFKSDVFPNEESRSEIAVPAEFFIDSRLLDDKDNKPVPVNRSHYDAALDATGSQFPETSLKDADHAWLTPVKAKADKMLIDELIRRGVIDEKFMLGVLSVDMSNPVFSKARCGLLRFVPVSGASGWRDVFVANLSRSGEPAAKQLRENLTDAARTPAYYRLRAGMFLNQCRLKIGKAESVLSLYKLLLQRRAEIRVSEISANKLGQILEPGFRVIFPETKDVVEPYVRALNMECEVV